MHLAVLRNLVAFGQVGVEVVFAVEHRHRRDSAVERERGANHMLDGFFVGHGQHAGHPQADGAHIRVGQVAEARRARAEHLALRQELRVNLHADAR
jgi:hypothetical protein